MPSFGPLPLAKIINVPVLVERQAGEGKNACFWDVLFLDVSNATLY